jgi:uncharacterized protein YraI
MKKREQSTMLRHLRRVMISAFVTSALATPALAQEPGDYPGAEEPNGYPIADVNLRAGPGTDYPVLLTVPADAPITILGCLEDYTWCDTVYEDSRGWMSSVYLAGYYDGEYYLLKDYAPDLGYQTVTFDVALYWDTYYRDQPFYNAQYRVSPPRGQDYVDDGVFYDRLSPYGSWTWTQGQYVWVPNAVDASWRPYTRGRWIYTRYGWTWVSDEPFGWATYHYGRWGYSGAVGWFWVPGNRWGPAWVSWRQSDDYLAWAPLPPAYDRGLSISISFGSIPNYYWSVVPSRYFLSRDLPRYYVHDRARWRSAYDRTRPIGHTTIVNNTVVNNVVNTTYVQQHTKQTVVERNVVRTRDFNRAGKIHGNAFEVYRPGLREGRGRFAPENPRRIDQVEAAGRNKRLIDDQPATDALMTPQAVRNAVENRKRGYARGEEFGPRRQSGPRDVGRDGPREANLGRGLPPGREAEGPPPASNKTRARPVPATDLGPGRRGPNTKRRGPESPEAISRSGPRNDVRRDGAGPGGKPGRDGRPNGQASQDRKPPMQAKESTRDQKSPPQMGARQPDRNEGGPKGQASQERSSAPRVNANTNRGPARTSPKSAAPQAKPQGKSTASPRPGPDKRNGPNQGASRKPDSATRSAPSGRGPVVDRKPPNAKKGPGGEDAKTKSQRPPAQARQTKPKPSAKRAPDQGARPAPKRTPPQAEPDRRKGPDQAKRTGPPPKAMPQAQRNKALPRAKPQAQSKKSTPQVKPKQKSSPNQNANAKRPPAKPKPQAQRKKPPEQGKDQKKGPRQAQQRKPPPKPSASAKRKPPQARPKKKSPPKQSASAKKPSTAKPKPQAKRSQPQAKPKKKSPPKQSASAKKTPTAKPKPQAKRSQPQSRAKKKSPPKQSMRASNPPAKPKPQARSKQPRPKAKTVGKGNERNKKNRRAGG